MHNRDANDNADRSYASLAWKMDTINVTRPAMPVAAPVEEALPATTPVVATKTVRRRPHSIRHASVPADDKISLITSETFGGNMPLIPLPKEEAVAVVAEEPAVIPPAKTVTIQAEQTKVVTAKDKPRHFVNIAPQAGVNLNGFYNTRTTHMETIGFHAGAMVNIGLGEHMALQPGAQYTMKGNKDERTTSNEGLSVTTSHQLTLNYVQVPVNLVYKFGALGDARFMAGVGPYVSYLVSSTDKVKTSAKNSENFTMAETTATSGTNLKKWDAGAGGFIGCQLPKGFYATGGLEMGLLNLQQNPSDYKHGDNTYSFLITLGYIIGPAGREY